MRALLTVRNVHCNIRCCMSPTIDELEGIEEHPPVTEGKLHMLCRFLKKKFNKRCNDEPA